MVDDFKVKLSNKKGRGKHTNTFLQEELGMPSTPEVKDYFEPFNSLKINKMF